MHDPATQLKVSVKNADDWLKRNIDAYYQWARTHNSLLIVTFDENDDRSGYVGLTDPKSRNRDRRNRIPTIITGARIRHGDYPEGKGVTHVNLLRTLEAMYGLPKSGSQQRFAAKFGIADNVIITDIFTGQK
jgi:acid phosphatase